MLWKQPRVITSLQYANEYNSSCQSELHQSLRLILEVVLCLENHSAASYPGQYQVYTVKSVKTSGCVTDRLMYKTGAAGCQANPLRELREGDAGCPLFASEIWRKRRLLGKLIHRDVDLKPEVSSELVLLGLCLEGYSIHSIGTVQSL
jgi:hypothetical protein